MFPRTVKLYEQQHYILILYLYSSGYHHLQFNSSHRKAVRELQDWPLLPECCVKWLHFWIWHWLYAALWRELYWHIDALPCTSLQPDLILCATEESLTVEIGLARVLPLQGYRLSGEAAGEVGTSPPQGTVSLLHVLCHIVITHL